MYFFGDIDQLLYYYPNSGGYCYCEKLIRPDDLTLQAHMPEVTSAAVLTVEAYEPDGVTLIGDITSFFKGVIAIDSRGECYFTLILQSFPSLFCVDCFVLRVRVTDLAGSTTLTIFDKYTQQYCVPSCCAGDGVLEAGTGESKKIFDAFNAAAYVDACNKPTVRIKTTFPCFDNYTGDYYSSAKRIIKGINTAAQEDVLFYKVTNFEALFKRIPREVKTTISLNCKTQKTEGTRRKMLQGSQFVPAWKMDEMENQFSANTVLINGTEYKIPSAVLFQKVQPYQRYEVQDFFRLDMTVEECRIWQIFGCGTNCLDLSRIAYAPLRVGEELYKVFDSDGALVALSQSDFITYLLSQPGITAVTDVSYVYTTYGYQSVLMIESDNGYVPSFFYLNYVGANAKWAMVSEVEDLYSGCLPATTGTITDAAFICDAAVLGTITDAAAAQLIDSVFSFGDWAVEPGSSAALSGPTVRLIFTSRNTLLANSQAAVGGDVVGYVVDNFVPSEERVITENLPADTYVVVGTDGTIRWFGALTDVTVSYGEVEFINVTYNI